MHLFFFLCVWQFSIPQHYCFSAKFVLYFVFIGQAVENNTRSLAEEICRILVAAAEEC